MSIEDLGEKLKNIQALRDALDDVIEKQEEFNKAINTSTSSLEKQLELKNQEIELLKNGGELIQEQINGVRERLLGQETVNTEQEAGLKRLLELYEEIRSAAEDPDVAAANLENLENQKKAIEKALETKGAIDGLQASTGALFGSFAAALKSRSFGPISAAATDFTAKLKAANIAAGGLGNVFKSVATDAGAKLTQGFKMMLALVGKLADFLADKFISTLILQTKELDNARASLAKVTTGTDRYKESLSELYYEQENVLFGFKEFGESLVSLDKGMSMFSRLSKDQQKELAQMNAEMTKIGVTNFPEIMDHMTRAMGRTPEEAKRVSASLITFARDLKVPAQIMMKDYQAAAGDLAKYGGQMENQFKKLAATAKTTGLSVQELLNISGKFDTYSDGARAVAGLNAILGGAYLNSVDMLKKGEEERIEAIAESIRMSGVLEREGDKYVRMALQQQIGAKDVAAVLRLVNKDSKEYLENQKKVAREESFAKSMEALKTAAISATPVIERINLLIKRIFTPEGGAEKILDLLESKLIPALGHVADAVDYVVKNFGLLGLVVGVGMLKVIGLFGSYVAGAAGVSLASKVMGKDLTKAGAQAGKGAGKMGVGFLKLAAGIIAVGAGLALAGLGMKLLFDSLGENLEKIAPHVMTLFPLAAGLLAVAGAMAALTPMALLGVIGVAAFSRNLSELAEALNELPEGLMDPKNGLTRLLEVTTEITSENVDNIKDIVEQANSYHKSVIEVQTKGGDTIVDAMKGAGSAAPAGGGQPIHIHVEIGGKKLETIIIDAINNKKKGRAYGF